MIPENLQIDDAALLPIAEKVLAGERLSFEEGVALYNPMICSPSATWPITCA